MNNLVIFGAPFSGKGTQSKILCEIYSFVHISVGDELRNEIETQSSIGKLANEFVLNGTMVPNKIIIEMISTKINGFPSNTKFIFDGIPRTIEQVTDFNLIIEQREILLTFILLNVSINELIRRAGIRARSENRMDDQKKSIIKNRIQIYEATTFPVIDSYSKIATINEVNGEQSIQKVHEDILALI